MLILGAVLIIYLLVAGNAVEHIFKPLWGTGSDLIESTSNVTKQMQEDIKADGGLIK